MRKLAWCGGLFGAGVKKILIIFLAIACLFSWGFANAVALKVSPAELKIQTNAGQTASKEIMATNPDNNVALYSVYPDEFSDLIKIKPESFVLESKQSQIVVISAKSQQTGVFSTYISVVGKPLGEQKLKANSGVKIPIEIRVSNNKKNSVFLASLSSFLEKDIPIWILILILGAITVGFFAKRKN
ncbi:MAG: hypothetical protein PHW31_02335 [Candidatus Pacebacteria bacterium]|nr:hypothetical protein [Candidatus Paceibacterota bacterium]